MLEGALANALTGLGADPEGAQRQWLGVWRMALPGSARLLRQLSASLAERAVPLLRSPIGEQALTSLLQVQPRLIFTGSLSWSSLHLAAMWNPLTEWS